MVRKRWKKIGIAAACVALVFVSAILFLQSRFIKQKILSAVQGSLREGQGLDLAVESFDYSLWKLRFVFKGVRLQKKDGSGRPPLLRAEEMRVNIPLSLLLRRRIRIQDIEMINPEITVQIEPDGSSNLPEKSQDRTIIPEFGIEHFEVKNARMSFRDKRSDFKLGLSEIWITGAGSIAAENALELSGGITDFSSLFFEGSVQGRFNVEDLRPLTAVDDPFSGNVDFRSNLKGRLKEMEARIDLKSEDLSYGDIANIGLSAALSWKEGALEVLSLDFKKERGEIHGQGTVRPLNWSEGSRLSLEWKDLDVEPLMDVLQSPDLLSGRAAGYLNVSWKGFSRDDVAAEGEVRFAPKEAKEHPNKGAPLSGRIVANAESGRLDITLLDISIPDADLKGRFSLSPDKLSGGVGLEVQSVGKIMPLILAFSGNLDEKDVRKLGVDGPVSISVNLGGDFKEPRVRFTVESANLRVLETQNLRIRGVAQSDLRSLQIESLLIEDGEGRIVLNGFYPLGPDSRSMRIDIEGEALSVAMIPALLGSKTKASGLIQVKARIEGSPGAPRAESKWLVSGASLSGENLGTIEIDAGYQNGKINVDSLRVAQSTGVLEGSGFYDLRENEFSVRLSGTSLPLDGLKVAEELGGLSATVDIDFEAYGTSEDPHLKTKGIIRGLSIGDRALSDWGFEAQSEQDKVLFKVEAPAFSGSLEGSVSLKSPFALNADLAIDKMRFEDVVDFTGLLTADVRVGMDLRDLRKTLRWEAQIENVQVQFGDRVFQNDGLLLFSFGSETFRVERLRLAGGGIHVEAVGSLPLNIPSSSKISLSADADLSLLNDILPLKDCRGFLKMESQLLGSLSDLEVAAVIDIGRTRFQFARFPLIVEDIQARLEIGKNIIRVDSFSGRMAEARFELKGDIPFASLPIPWPVKFHAFEEKKAELALDIENWDPSSLGALFPGRMFERMRGAISGRIELEGKTLRPEDLSGKGVFERFQLDVAGVSFTQDSPSRMSWEGGKISIEALSLRGGENRLNISGTVPLMGGDDGDLSLDGELDIGLLGVFSREGVFSGTTRFQIQAVQSRGSPKIQGFLDIRDGRYRRDVPRILLEQVNGGIKFKADQVEIEKIQGMLNGGKTILNGKIGLAGWTVHDAEIVLKNENSLFNFPQGLNSQVSSDLKFLSDGRSHRIAGAVNFVDARYRDDFKAGTALYNLLRRGSVRETLREPVPFLKNTSLDIRIGIDDHFIIDNNIAKTEISADLKLVGTIAQPNLSGRAGVIEGGEVYFNQNTFSIEQGTVDFINPTRIEPDLNLSARTKVRGYDIRLILRGTPDKFSANLVSDPPLSEPNIISLLVMGRTLESASASVLSVAGGTALAYLNNAVTGKIEQAAARVLGLESVRIDSGLVSTQENPEARITVGQHLTRDFELVFSQHLKDARNQMWMVNYNPHKNFNIQGIKRDNNEFNLALQHEIQFGSKAVPSPVPADPLEKKSLILNAVKVEGDPGIPVSAIYRSLKLTKEKKIDFAVIQDALDRIRRLYQKNDYLGFSLAVKKEETNGRLDIFLQIDAGPKIILEYEGASIPQKMKKDIVRTWMGSSFGRLALDDIEQTIRVHFMEKRYYQVQVGSRERTGEKGERRLVFQTSKGLRYGKPNIEIKGNRTVSTKTLAADLERNGLANGAFYKPEDVVKSIENLYLRQGFLRPKVRLPVVRFEPEEKKAYVEVELEEGTRFKVGSVKIKGLQSFPEDQILGEIDMRPGDIFSPARYGEIGRKIQELYVPKGFNDVRIQSDIQTNAGPGTVDLTIDIRENGSGVIAEIAIEGNASTNEKIIRRELMFDAGDAVDYRVINESRKRLYDLGIFERVDIAAAPLGPAGKNHAPAAEAPGDNRKDFRVVVAVREFKPFRLRYGFQYDSETSFGVLASLVNRNFLGKADLVGTSFHLNRDEQDARAFIRSPYFFGKKINTEYFFFSNRMLKPAFTIDRTGFTVQQQLKIKDLNIVSYDYSLERQETSYPLSEGIPRKDTIDHIGTLNVAFTRDTRDDILNATRGMFLSQNIRYAPGLLGFKARFIRYFGQVNAFQRISDVLIYAASIRLGLGKGLGEDMPASERFFAGGGTTVRGFNKDELGPRDPSSDFPSGGDAVMILNQEFRFSVVKKSGGVVFLDLGNVYPKYSDFSFLKVRKTAGFGFRLQTPFVLVRFDWGFKLDRRPGETRSQVFFSIGQAF